MRVIGFGIFLLLATGCDRNRISTPEKENQELKEKIQKQEHGTADLESQAKCSRDAKAWFDEGWRGTEAQLLNQTNHYKTMNKCFILVEYHYLLGKGPDWINHVTLSDVYENSTYGTFSENHFVFGQPATKLSEKTIGCELGGKKCKSLEEFNDLLRPYMNN